MPTNLQNLQFSREKLSRLAETARNSFEIVPNPSVHGYYLVQRTLSIDNENGARNNANGFRNEPFFVQSVDGFEEVKRNHVFFGPAALLEALVSDFRLDSQIH